MLVTGGTGFLGTALVSHLARLGWEVHVLARPSTSRAPSPGLEPRWHAGDLLERDSVERAVSAVAARGAEGGVPARVVHGAALISYRTRDAERARRVNIEGTRTLLEACRTEGVGRFCLVSSIVTVGHAPDARSVLDEDAAYNGAVLRAHYVTSKRAAEELVLEAAAERDVVVVNPAAIFGPGSRSANTTRFLQRFAAGALGPFAPPGSLSVVGVEDVAEGIRLALLRGARGRRYLLAESCWTLRELFDLAAQVFERRPPRGTVPLPLWRLGVAGAGLVDRLRALELTTPQSLRLLGVHYRGDATRARRELGWEPEPFRSVLARTVAWMRAEGLL